MKFNAKSILGLLKQHIFIVVFSLLIILILPACFLASTMWNKALLSKHEKAANDELAKVRSAKEVTYLSPQLDPKQEIYKYVGTPHTKSIEHFRAWKEKYSAQVDKLGKAGEDFNKGVGQDAVAVGRKEHAPLVAGIFPRVQMSDSVAKNVSAMRDAEIAKINEFEDALLGKRGRTNPYGELLRSVNAGAPADKAMLTQTIRDVLERRKIEVTSSNRQMTGEEAQQLRDLLMDQRLGAYQGRASQLGVYATLDCLPADTESGSADTGSQGMGMSGGAASEAPYARVPMGKVDEKNLKVEKMFLYQWDIWVLSDLFSSVRLANTDAAGKLASVDKAVVKRIKRVRLLEPEGMLSLTAAPAVDDGTNSTPQVPAGPTSEIPGLVPTLKSASITGRVRYGGNPFFELRRAEMTVVVSSLRINEYLSAIARANFMSTTDLDIAGVDVWGDLSEGFYYGPEHVVEATVQIETIWLKSWLLRYMPPAVQKALGMEVAAEAAAGEGGPGVSSSSG